MPSDAGPAPFNKRVARRSIWRACRFESSTCGGELGRNKRRRFVFKTKAAPTVRLFNQQNHRLSPFGDSLNHHAGAAQPRVHHKGDDFANGNTWLHGPNLPWRLVQEFESCCPDFRGIYPFWRKVSVSVLKSGSVDAGIRPRRARADRAKAPTFRREQSLCLVHRRWEHSRIGCPVWTGGGRRLSSKVP
jgi:hypothetical protein